MARERIEITPGEAILDFPWNALVLGNGASIALYDEFSYDTLHGVAESQGLLPLSAPIFARLGTTDFEHAGAQRTSILHWEVRLPILRQRIRRFATR